MVSVSKSHIIGLHRFRAETVTSITELTADCRHGCFWLKLDIACYVFLDNLIFHQNMENNTYMFDTFEDRGHG